ncbi:MULTISPECIES: DNA internalization-related competence protein ComEC/Rec2 [unclassified Acinetobacter]|uniref:DNA internalization-related competence protein ComEC/Rec2 n=1 Tax=unclassified Acinetobacter TaxID=196816 RepID=UPI0035B95A6E
MLRALSLAWIIGIASLSILPLSTLKFLQPIWQYHFASSILTIILIVSLFFSFVLWQIKVKNNWIITRFLLIIVACTSCFLLAYHYTDQQMQQRLSQQISQRQKVDAVVYIQSLSEGKLNEQRQQATLLLPKQQGLNSLNQANSLNILLYPKRIYNADGQVTSLSFGDENQEDSNYLKLGHYYQVTLDLKPPHGYANMGSFDQEKWLLQQGIVGTATVLFQKPLTEHEIIQQGWSDFVAQQQNWLPRWRLNIEKMRLAYRKAILNNQPEQQSRALLLGLLTGDRSAINKDTTQLYQIMGISHLLAISGPHVLILASLVTWLVMAILHFAMRRNYNRHLSYLYRYVPKQYLYLPLFLICVSFYTAFTGFDIPAMRTWLMVSLCSLALLLNIRISSINLLLLSACLVLCFDSFAMLSSAFWLSFLASAILLKVYRDIAQGKNHDEDEIGFTAKIKQAILVLWQSQWRISLALIPIVLWQFQAVSMISLLINLIAIPFLSIIIVPINIISALIYPILPSLSQLIWLLLANLLAVFNFILDLIQPLAEKLYLLSYLTPTALMCLTFAIVIFMLPKGLVPRYWALLFILLAYLPPQRAMLNFDILDVGQGQATVLRTKQHQMLIDTGAGAWQAGQLSMGDRVVLPFLRQNGIRSLDEILLSHLDMDHSGGAETIIKNMPVKQLRTNEYDGYKTNYVNVPYIECNQGQKWQWDNVKIQILYPRQGQSRKDQNETSCVVLIETMQYGEQPMRILIMGDVGFEGEYYLLQDYPNLTADILVLGHHGSKYSSAYEFLKQINPQLAVISAGYDNRYGHPTVETLTRLHDLNIPYVNTAEVGAVNIQLKDQKSLWQWSAYRATRPWLMPNKNQFIQLGSD